MFRSWFCLIAPCMVLLCPWLGGAREVRVATYNVRQGVGTVGSAEYSAVKGVLQRVDADIIAFQELTSVDRSNWEALAQELGYAVSMFSDLTRLSGDLHTAYYSRWPILNGHSVHSPSGANEISRPPFHVEVMVAGAEKPLALWTLHHKAYSGAANEFRRAIEAYRTAQDMDAYSAAHPDRCEIVVLGDFNGDVDQFQTDQFFSLPAGLPSSYALGSDISFPVPYRFFPRDAYEVAGGGMRMLETFQEDSAIDNTFIHSSGRLDYIFVSDAIYTHAQGGPLTEIYNSVRDDGIGGLPKAGNPLPSSTSAVASDHHLVFADIQLTDAPAPGDELPGSWRQVYFGHTDPQAGDLSRAMDDADADGYTNLAEYTAGTHPLEATDLPRFMSIVPEPAGVDLGVSTLTGRVYTIEYTDALRDPDAWDGLPGFTGVHGTGATWIHTDPAVPDVRAYRLRIELAP